jgi:hypothetical protein
MSKANPSQSATKRTLTLDFFEQAEINMVKIYFGSKKQTHSSVFQVTVAEKDSADVLYERTYPSFAFF